MSNSNDDDDIPPNVAYIFGEPKQHKKESDGNPKTQNDIIPYLNKRYYSIYLGGRYYIGDRKTNELSTEKDFLAGKKDWLMPITTTDPVKGVQNIVVNYAEYWAKNKFRKKYEGRIFDPRKIEGDNDEYQNMWRGFALTPQKGDCSAFYEMIQNTICNRNTNIFNFLLEWIGHLFQRPWEKCEFAIILKGDEGIGKSLFGNIIRVLIDGLEFSPKPYKRPFTPENAKIGDFRKILHGYTTGNPNDVWGDYNGQMDGKIFLQLEEVGTWGGDVKHGGKLNHLITSPTITINPKNKAQYECNNFMRLLMTTNNKWVVPASFTARRYLVINVSSENIQNHEYFGNIINQMIDGGYAALMYDALHRDISGFNCHAAYQTDALLDQKIESLDPCTRWWYEVLRKGEIFHIESDSKMRSDGYIVVDKNKLYRDGYEEWFDRMCTRQRKLSYDSFANALRSLIPVVINGKIQRGLNGRIKSLVGTVQDASTGARSHVIPPLFVCRELFAFLINGRVVWGDDGDTEGENCSEIVWKQAMYERMA